MRGHGGSAGVEEQGCGALRSLAVNDENRVTIAGLHGIAVVIKAMRGHGGSAGVQRQGCAALLNLALNAENR
eukprot:1223009-Rhodomonas_salina.1